MPADSGISVQPNEQIFDTMCALDASGFEAEENTLAEMPARLALRERLLQLQGPATEAIRKFYREHVLASPTETLTPFMTFALVSGPPPDFQLPRSRCASSVGAHDRRLSAAARRFLPRGPS